VQPNHLLKVGAGTKALTHSGNHYATDIHISFHPRREIDQAIADMAFRPSGRFKVTRRMRLSFSTFRNSVISLSHGVSTSASRMIFQTSNRRVEND
jgi:hypothetical protein